jgi:inositol-1,4,5-trisphosphate 5-phosphatase
LQFRSVLNPFHTFLLLYSVVFWFGDLNFRIDELEIPAVKTAIDNNKLTMLWEKDQVRGLFKIKAHDTVFNGACNA